MWMIAIPIAGAVGAGIGWLLSREEEEAKERWESSAESVHSALIHAERAIELALQDRNASLQFEFLVTMHHEASMQGQRAYAALRDARLVLDSIGRQLVAAKKDRAEARRALSGERDPARRRELVENIEALTALRDSTFPAKDELKAQRDELLGRVQALNAKTRSLKLQIRDECGSRGRSWFARLEQRTAARRLGQR